MEKQFASMCQASVMLATDNGGTLSGVFTSVDEFRNKFSNYMSFVKKVVISRPLLV